MAELIVILTFFCYYSYVGREYLLKIDVLKPDKSFYSKIPCLELSYSYRIRQEVMSNIGLGGSRRAMLGSTQDYVIFRLENGFLFCLFDSLRIIAWSIELSKTDQNFLSEFYKNSIGVNGVSPLDPQRASVCLSFWA